MGDYSASVDQIVNAAAIAIANWSTGIAIASIRWLLSTLGQATEPDLTAIVPVYDRLLAVMVHLELVIRSALILTVTAFVPLVCVLSIWPRLAGAATQLASFMIGLLLSKFVVATSVYVGFRLIVVALTSATDTDTTENWMASGVAVLLIAALSPLVLFQAVRIGHASAGQVARGWVGGMVAFAPPTRLLNKAHGLGGSVVRNLQRSAKAFKASRNRAS